MRVLLVIISTVILISAMAFASGRTFGRLPADHPTRNAHSAAVEERWDGQSGKKPVSAMPSGYRTSGINN